MTVISDLQVQDIRFPTSRERHGSDAMNPDPDYSAAYVRLPTDDGLCGTGLAFTIGRGTEICVKAIEALRPLVVGRSLAELSSQMGHFCRQLSGDSQLRWLGPEKGVMHMAIAAVVNAVWDLWAKAEGKPLWRLLCDLPAETLVDCIDFRYLTDALTPDEARQILQRMEPGREERIAQMQAQGYPAYTTSVGWLGYDEGRIRQLCRQAIAEGWTAVKVKVGANLQDDLRRLQIVRDEIGPDRRLMLDANQIWDVEQAIESMRHLAAFDPWWIEEPTSPDDILGHARIAREIAPIRVATGEACQNRIMFKQFFQAQAIQVCQIDSCRLAGVSEALAVLLLAAKFGVPVCPHGGGVGLCEHIQHLSLFDYIGVSGTLEDRMAEYVDHLHEHFLNPVQIRQGRYLPPTAPGYSVDLCQDSCDRFAYPDGAAWAKVQRSMDA